MLADPSQLAGIRCSGKPNVNGIEMRQRGTVGVVDGAVAFIRNDQIEVCISKPASTKLGHYHIKRSDNDLAFKTTFSTIE